MNTTIGERIRKGRKAKGLTQSELAVALGMSDMTVRRWENDERSPRLEEMNKLAEVLNVPVTYFTEDSSVPVLMKNEQSSSERKQNIAVLTFRNGEKIEAPATPEGYSFLKELFAMSLGGQPAMA